MVKKAAILLVLMLGVALIPSGCLGSRAQAYDDNYYYDGYYDQYGIWHYYTDSPGYYYNNHHWYSSSHSQVIKPVTKIRDKNTVQITDYKKPQQTSTKSIVLDKTKQKINNGNSYKTKTYKSSSSISSSRRK